ncbi:YodL domain-containing protein [Metabacillus arenae]|uniref:YodL-like domain-containing protein n=1 Tax=Metabacillus arenae TaxID=2771434 RepID=A0A926NJK8_9BACI|nr:YodL domain-containing protein [Metabacillus arenae]MBD1379041.1 hypothetical protein [Metabacillus arenae]
MALRLFSRRKVSYDITIFQTPKHGDHKGYRQVYRLEVFGCSHNEVLDRVFSKFNVPDTVPKDFTARYISTGDILMIDQGKKGKYYYKLFPGGWEQINRIFVR